MKYLVYMTKEQVRNMARVSKDAFEHWLSDYDSENRFQTIRLPYGLEIKHGRDDIKRLFDGMMLPDEFWKEKTILDIGCDCGGWCFEALHRGATSVCGFDNNENIIELANRLAQKFDYTNQVVFNVFDFNLMKWKKIATLSDVVFINQCLYRFHRGDRTLIEISPYCRDYLFLYTWTTDLDPYPEISETLIWTPTVKDLSQKAYEAGFAIGYVIINDEKEKEEFKRTGHLREKHQFLFSREKEITFLGTQATLLTDCASHN